MLLHMLQTASKSNHPQHFAETNQY